MCIMGLHKLLLFGIICSSATSMKILALLPVPSSSHYFTFKPLLEKLAERNHEVTFIGAFQPQSPTRNLEYIVLLKDHEASQRNTIADDAQYTPRYSFNDIQSKFGNNVINLVAKAQIVWGLFNYSRITCNNFLNSPIMHDFAAQDRHYDLIIAEAFHTNCWFGFVQKYKAHLVLFSTSAPLVWYYDNMGLPNNPSYVPNSCVGFTTNMSFLERLQNMLVNVAHLYYFHHVQEPVNLKSAKKFFGDDLQDFEEVLRNVSVFLSNSHFSVLGSVPTVPGLIDVGGIHIGEVKELPKVGLLEAIK